MPAIQSTGYLKASEVVTDVMQRTNDTDQGSRHLTRHFYLSQVQQAITELGFDSHFDLRSHEVPIPDDLRVQLPDNMVAPIVIYLFNGENCDVGTSVRLHFKQNFKHRGGSGFLAVQKGLPDGRDPLVQPTVDPASYDSGIYYGNIQNGWLMLSSNCNVWQNIHIEYAGAGFDQFGDDVLIPMFARQAVTDYVVLRAAQARRYENPSYWQGVINDHQNQMSAMGGSWQRARKRVAVMSRWQRVDWQAYNTGWPVSNRPA